MDSLWAYSTISISILSSVHHMSYGLWKNLQGQIPIVSVKFGSSDSNHHNIDSDNIVLINSAFGNSLIKWIISTMGICWELNLKGDFLQDSKI